MKQIKEMLTQFAKKGDNGSRTLAKLLDDIDEKENSVNVPVAA